MIADSHSIPRAVPLLHLYRELHQTGTSIGIKDTGSKYVLPNDFSFVIGNSHKRPIGQVWCPRIAPALDPVEASFVLFEHLCYNRG